jgi:hypothetical protein
MEKKTRSKPPTSNNPHNLRPKSAGGWSCNVALEEFVSTKRGRKIIAWFFYHVRGWLRM